MNAFCIWERLRGDAGSRTIVVVRVVEIVGVELDLVVVEVEVRSVVELTITIEIFVFIHPCHRKLRFTSAKNRLYSRNPEFYTTASLLREPATDKDKQYLLKQHAL